MLLKESYKVEDIQDKSYQKKHPKTQIQGNLENQHTVGIGWIWFTIAFVDFPEIALWRDLNLRLEVSEVAIQSKYCNILTQEKSEG